MRNTRHTQKKADAQKVRIPRNRLASTQSTRRHCAAMAPARGATEEDSIFNREDGIDGQTVLADRELYSIKNISKKRITCRGSYKILQA